MKADSAGHLSTAYRYAMTESLYILAEDIILFRTFFRNSNSDRYSL